MYIVGKGRCVRGWVGGDIGEDEVHALYYYL